MASEREELMARVSANLMVIMGDALDMSIKFAQETAERTGHQIKGETKFYLNKAAYAVHMAGDVLRKSSESTRIGVGDSSDILLSLILLIIDRTCGIPENLEKFYGIFKSEYPSLLNLPLERYEKNAFNKVIDDYTDTEETDD